MDRVRADLLLLGWNTICLAIPVWLYVQPSPEPSMARAAVVVFFAGPAVLLALAGNVVSLFLRRSVLGMALALITAAMAIIWLGAVLIS